MGKEFYVDKKRAAGAFNAYVRGYDISNDKVRLKVEHTGRVAGFCEGIAESLALSKSDCLIAWLIGLLHDIGRFEQLRRYDTFNDYVSIDHGRLGADILFGKEDGESMLIRRFLDEGYPEEEHLIERAIRLHSDFELPADLSERERLFSQIIRDADKVDIIRVNTEYSLESIYNTDRKTILNEEISPEVMKESLKHRTILRKLRKTTVDIIVGQISLPYGIVYPVSLEMIKKQGYLDKLMAFESENDKTAADFSRIKNELLRWMEDKTGQKGQLS